MSIFYQHIGEVLWSRDAPRSIGAPLTGVKRFYIDEIEPYINHLQSFEVALLKSKLEELAPTGFQIWGIPAGAGTVLAGMKTGDFLMLLESTDFRYIGQVIHRISEPCYDLSTHIWNEQRFPIIVLLQGEMISYAWSEFLTEFDFAAKYFMRGNTARIADDRIERSQAGSEENFVAQVLTSVGVNIGDMETDFRAFADNLKYHFRLVIQREAQSKFRRDLLAHHTPCCCVCDIAIPDVLEAAHIIPKQSSGTDDYRNGLLLCALHHRMYDLDIFTIQPSSLMIVMRDDISREDAHIDRVDLHHIASQPHPDAFEWRWRRWMARQDSAAC